MDTITEKSGHQMTGMAVSVCLTPAAPSPLPIPYPTLGTVAEGIIDPCMRTKIEGAVPPARRPRPLRQRDRALVA
ncbi:hypothetical protein [Sorangium sp. So ce1151]|uniref:hypothetical protein n=1 Tax=Sorangium sp. So ce1151 TaxID=3133332 RepID=UPI003F60E089